MNCSGCCPVGDINNLNSTFDANQAHEDAQRYLKKGLDRRGQKLIAYLLSHCPEPVSVLDIGCGAGGVHHELLRHGVANRAVGVDVSSAYLTAAKANAAQLNLSDRVTYEQQDFAQAAEAFAPADVVLMDRVICCYPYLTQLLGAAAQHSQRYLSLSFPIDAWWTRLPYRLLDAFQILFRNKYRFYLHSQAKVISLIEAAGLRQVHRDCSSVWQIMVFARP